MSPSDYSLDAFTKALDAAWLSYKQAVEHQAPEHAVNAITEIYQAIFIAERHFDSALHYNARLVLAFVYDCLADIGDEKEAALLMNAAISIRRKCLPWPLISRPL